MGYTHGVRWTDELVEKEILNVIEKLNIDHFPTHEEMVSVNGNKSLACRIAKTQGSTYWAEKLGISIKNSDTSFGNSFEIFAISDIFENTGLTSIQTSSGHPFDLQVESKIKIDVKVSKSYQNTNNAKAYSFNLEKREPTCDIFILYCVDEKSKVIKTLIIPSCVLVGQTQVGVGDISKWDFYKNKWSYIGEYNNFFKKYSDERTKIH